MKLTKSTLVGLIKETYEDILAAQAELRRAPEAQIEDPLEEIYNLAQDASEQLQGLEPNDKIRKNIENIMVQIMDICQTAEE